MREQIQQLIEDDDDYFDDDDECCEECGCYHSHFRWCSQYDPPYYPGLN